MLVAKVHKSKIAGRIILVFSGGGEGWREGNGSSEGCSDGS
jgi:hypothetical protein